MTLGRICDHPCEDNCCRAQMDEAVAVRDLKRFAADYAFNNGVEYLARVKAKRDEKVAIVGAGPAGLAAAYDLAREGFQVTVFESLPVVGGLMVTGCPEYRLPGKIVEREIENVQNTVDGHEPDEVLQVRRIGKQYGRQVSKPDERECKEHCAPNENVHDGSDEPSAECARRRSRGTVR